MTDSTGKAVATRRSFVADLLDNYSGDLARVMPKQTTPEAFMGLALSYVRKSPDLTDAARKNPGSLMFALRECAALGHMPMKGIFALTARKDRNAEGGVRILGIEEVRGTIERMYRAGAVTSVKVETVRETDNFRWSPTRMLLPEHEFDALASFEDRGPLVGVYAWAIMADGVTPSKCVVMGKSRVMLHRAKAATKMIWDSEWDFQMWEKTALHALEKVVPTSAEYMAQRAKSAVEATKGAFVDLPEPVFVAPSPDDMEPVDDVHDADVVSEHQNAAPGTPA